MLAARFGRSSGLILRSARGVIKTPNWTNPFHANSAYCRFSPNSQQGSIRTAFVSRRKIVEKGGQGLKATTTPLASTSSSTWKRIAWFVKVTRIPILLTAIYTLGYQQGVVDSVRNPLKLQQGTFETLCKDMGVNSGEDVDIIWEKKPPPRLSRLGWYEEQAETKHDPRAEKVAAIGRHIIRAARLYVREKLVEVTNKAKKKLEDETMTQLEYIRRLHEDEDVKFWVEALERVEGYSADGILNWQYILVGTSVPNAFVAEMLPQRFFVTTGLFEKFIENDDELAMVLGHELSHLIMGHVSHSNWTEFAFRGLEITVLMLDPTEGMLSLAIASFLASTRDALMAAHSRSHEMEADELGCKLAAMACYNTAKGCRVFLKMHEEDKERGYAGNDLMASHPPSLERYDFLVELSSEENMAKYSYCNRLGSRMKRALTMMGDQR